MNNVDINFEKLTDLVAMKDEIEKKNYIDNINLQTEKNVVNIKEEELVGNKFDDSNAKDIKKLQSLYERVFNEHELRYLWKMFINYSSDGVSIINNT